MAERLPSKSGAGRGIRPVPPGASITAYSGVFVVVVVVVVVIEIIVVPRILSHPEVHRFSDYDYDYDNDNDNDNEVEHISG